MRKLNRIVMVMQDMKSLFDKWQKEENECCYDDLYSLNKYQEGLGLFFWERGGKQYCFHWKGWANIINEIVETAKGERNNECGYVAQQAQDFLDCVDCLGKERVKELTENMKEK